MITSCYLPDDVSLTGSSGYALFCRQSRANGCPALTYGAYLQFVNTPSVPLSNIWMFTEGGGMVLLPSGETLPRRLVVYHGNCRDGFGAAWAVRQLVEGPIEFRAATYGAPPITPQEVRGRDVLFVDFAYDPGTMDALRFDAGVHQLWVLDHHATAQLALEGASYAFFDLNRSGAGLAWDVLEPRCTSQRPRPWIVDYVEDRDLWRHALPFTKEVNAYLGTLPFDLTVWDMVFRGAGGYNCAPASRTESWLPALKGEAVLAGIRQYVSEMRLQAQQGVLAGCLVPCVNAPEIHASDLLNDLAQNKPFAIAYFRRGDGLWKYSLRSDENGKDVSLIARSFGGGGHPHAAGFQLAEPLDLELVSMPRLAAVR